MFAVLVVDNVELVGDLYLVEWGFYVAFDYFEVGSYAWLMFLVWLSSLLMWFIVPLLLFG